jgi:hypothetical protein
MEILDKGYMVIPVILFIVGIAASWHLGSLGIERIKDK